MQCNGDEADDDGDNDDDDEADNQQMMMMSLMTMKMMMKMMIKQMMMMMMRPLLASTPPLTQQGHCQAKLETNIWIFKKIDKCRTKFERKSIENDPDYNSLHKKSDSLDTKYNAVSAF